VPHGSGEIHCSCTGNVNACVIITVTCVKIYKQKILKKIGFIIFINPFFLLKQVRLGAKAIDPQTGLGKQHFVQMWMFS